MAARSAEASSGPLSSFQLDYASGLPVWIQIKNRISYLVATGEYAPGDRLPTVRSLAVDLDISYNTVNRAYMDLERDGVISTRKGRGTFVSESMRPTPDEATDATLGLLADELIQSAFNAGMEAEDLIAFLRRRIDEKG